MLRKQITMNICNASDSIAIKRATQYDLSKNNYIEMILILGILNSDYSISNTELDELFDGLITNKTSTNRKEFRELQKTVNKDAKKEILKFIYNFNLIPNVNIQTKKQANFNKDGQYLFYFAIKDMKNIDIDVYIRNLGISVVTIGALDKNSREYVYLGREQWFNNSKNKSLKFKDICTELGVSGSYDCVKIHYEELYKLIPILRRI